MSYFKNFIKSNGNTINAKRNILSHGKMFTKYKMTLETIYLFNNYILLYV